MKQEILDTLFGNRDILTDMIIALSPGNATEQQQLAALMLRRDRITMVIQDLINSDINSATTGIEAELDQLGAASASLEALAATFAKIADALALVDQIVKLATTIASKVASL